MSADAKVKLVMHEWKAGALHSGSPKGPRVTSKPQALAIALSEQRQADKGRRGLLNGAAS
jgi:hypothetical protein